MTKTNKIALVTGGNKGIGFEVAKQIGQAGCQVLLSARNKKLGAEALEKLNKLGIKAEFVELDLLKPDTIEKAASFIGEKYGKLDILVNNAGIIDRQDGSPGVAKVEAVEKTMATNFLGTLRVTQAMLPLLQKSEHASIVNVSSGLGSLAFNGDRESPYADIKYIGYSASKAALNMLTVQLAYELRNSNIKVNSADPGYTATDLNDNQGYQTIEEGAAETVRLALIDETGPTGQYSNKEGVLAW